MAELPYAFEFIFAASFSTLESLLNLLVNNLPASLGIGTAAKYGISFQKRKYKPELQATALQLLRSALHEENIAGRLRLVSATEHVTELNECLAEAKKEVAKLPVTDTAKKELVSRLGEYKFCKRHPVCDSIYRDFIRGREWFITTCRNVRVVYSDKTVDKFDQAMKNRFISTSG